MDWKQAAKILGVVWLVFRVLAWLVTPSPKEFNKK